MKKLNLAAAIGASFLMFLSASVWEGTAAIGNNLQENGPYLATNSFPVNTLVEVVNLENNMSATFIVSAPLDNSGLLALLSKSAADSIGLDNAGRIRMKEKDDQINYSGLGERRFFSGDPNYTSGENFNLDSYNLALIPAETRPPEDNQKLNPDSFVSSMLKSSSLPKDSYATTFFSAPLIQYFESGMYYVQIGAYKTAQTVESEISKIDKSLPVSIMKIGSDEEPVYRVLIGPLKLGESGAILQRYKAIYKDAFLRVGN